MFLDDFGHFCSLGSLAALVYGPGHLERPVMTFGHPKTCRFCHYTPHLGYFLGPLQVFLGVFLVILKEIDGLKA